MLREIEQTRQCLRSAIRITRIRETAARITKFVEKWMAHCIDCGETLSRSVLKQSGDKVDCIIRGLTENLDRPVRND